MNIVHDTCHVCTTSSRSWMASSTAIDIVFAKRMNSWKGIINRGSCIVGVFGDYVEGFVLRQVYVPKKMVCMCVNFCIENYFTMIHVSSSLRTPVKWK